MITFSVGLPLVVVVVVADAAVTTTTVLLLLLLLLLFSLYIGVRANFFSRGLSHLCPKFFSTAPEKLLC